ncbi:helix-turn-helix transcriptional regulator [Cognatiyoonia sp. IB215182]|uniref:helix-turn-helix domain-containing protein n=1 Tax=Cognatiyoonia sp. IB215182 TaxID=3097353 RepID=UPI002A0B83B4|nr:helix-turn-helix transcriptional regulator [Cognatiyoonia sp. IB215182]MDX8354513.1 helix-turn-helix transcriptional regulator [Cognatiyoonia sp. IB215182]
MNVAALPLDFGNLLRSWRSERRLSQADLANVIETPSRHVSFLETGRAKPSREMVTRLATALHVPLRDRNLLLRAAGFADLYAERHMSEEEMSMLRKAVLRLMTAHDPYPAFVVDRDWTVQDANASGRMMLAPIAATFPFDDPENRPNMLDITFSPDGIRPFIVNWEDYARQAIQRIHREALGPADVRRALDRIGRHPDLPKDWWAFDVQYTLDPIFTVQLRNGDRRLNFFSVLASIAVPTAALAQELRVETLFPADQETEDILSTLGEE